MRWPSANAIRATRADVEQLATRDGLTQPPNRLLLMDRLDQVVIGAARDGGQIALLLDRSRSLQDHQ